MLKTIAASILVLGVATSALAQSAMSPAPASGAMMKDDMVTVVQITEGNKSSDANNTQIPPAYRNASSDVMMKAQDMIKADPMLMSALEKKNVQIQNVVGVDTAANGGKVVYVK